MPLRKRDSNIEPEPRMNHKMPETQGPISANGIGNPAKQGLDAEYMRSSYSGAD